MINLCWSRPSDEKQKDCLERSNAFTYDSIHKGATSRPVSSLKQDKELSDNGFLVDHGRTLVGSGLDTFEKGKTAMKNWRHFNLNWAFVGFNSPIQTGARYCVCLKGIIPWTLMPLEVIYVNDDDETTISSDKKAKTFSFAGGALEGHLLEGEERFSITMDEEGNVWYEILAISKPANILSRISYPYVRAMQKRFMRESMSDMKKILSTQD